MAFVQFSKVSLAFGDRDILRDVSLNLMAGSKAALAGANGAGKTTLMKVINGLIPADSGERAVQKGTQISYLPQSGIVHQGRTLIEEAELAFSDAANKLKRMDDLGHELSAENSHSQRTAALLEEHHRLGEEVENSGYYRRDASISIVLKGLGFKDSDQMRNVEEFSGGWQMRIALAKVLLENPDILLLDEPTNYLDIEARTWLEEWLLSFSGGYLLVSHDRYFLDQTVNEVYEIFQANCKRYAGNYSAYEKTREIELESLLKRYAAQQEEIEKTESLIRRFRYKASKAAFAQELIKRLEKMERIEIPENLKRINISLPPPPHSGRIALTLDRISKSYGENRVLCDIDLTIESGEKLLVAGVNGAGKTTLLRILAGQDSSFEGQVKYGAGISAGYFSQDAAETLSGSRSILEYLEAEAPTHLIPRIRDMLGAFLFRGDDVYKALSVLSGGEKSRLALLRMLLKPLNLLILDEPTNHLDLHSKDILLNCLKAFSGTVIFVSHDRAFMEALATKTLGLGAGRHRLYYGGYAYYLERMSSNDEMPAPVAIVPSSSKDENIQAQPILVQSSPANTLNTADPVAASDPLPKTILPNTILIKAGTRPVLSTAERREQEKQRQAIIRRLERQEAEIIKALEDLNADKTRLETDLARPENYSSGEKAKAIKLKLDETVAALEAKSREWESKAEELETARNG
ncbi:MAG: ABC-F family ATP-binding cassette domain-containing protein [Treponema sp.]|jgi:ATP-binding cassette subfamily F protein 3|nr:ABC-F family ATP-binding cassette domain-containing protein [Treponema sp.]